MHAVSPLIVIGSSLSAHNEPDVVTRVYLWSEALWLVVPEIKTGLPPGECVLFEGKTGRRVPGHHITGRRRIRNAIGATPSVA